eukprot:3705691-Pleurochrysis_carterae.AAC.8
MQLGTCARPSQPREAQLLARARPARAEAQERRTIVFAWRRGGALSLAKMLLSCSDCSTQRCCLRAHTARDVRHTRNAHECRSQSCCVDASGTKDNAAFGPRTMHRWGSRGKGKKLARCDAALPPKCGAALPQRLSKTFETTSVARNKAREPPSISMSAFCQAKHRGETGRGKSARVGATS